MLRRPSLISMVTRLAGVLFELAGARRVVAVAMAAAVEAVARDASTVARMVTCRETAPSRGKAAAEVEAKTVSTAASLGICPGTVRNPRSQESLVVVEVAEVASIAGRTDTCRVNAQSQGSPESQGDLAAGLLAEMATELSL